jgi:hypothetical protein
MGLKDLIFVNPDDKNKEKEGQARKEFTSKFPDSGATVKTAPPKTQGTTVTAPVKAAAITPDNPACGPHMDKIMSLYDQGFDGLNLDGYDFYEFFKGIISNADNPQMYGMALTMAKGIDSNVSKEKLLEQSQYYINEINKVHTQYSLNGSQKNEEQLKLKAAEESTLTLALTNIDNEIARLTAEKASKESALKTIDTKYADEIEEIQCKIMANDMAKDRIVGSIMKVVNGIKNNL